MKTVKEIRAEYETHQDVNRAIAEYSELIEAHSAEADEAYTERGLLYWKLDKRAEAIND